MEIDDSSHLLELSNAVIGTIRSNRSIANGLIILIVLILINSFFAAAEMALVSVNKNLLKKQAATDKKASRIIQVLKDKGKFLATIQVCITFGGFLASIYAADYFVDPIIQPFASYVSLSVIRPVAVIIITLVLSYFTLVFGELLPKRVAIMHPEKVSRFVINGVYFSTIVFRPFTLLLNLSLSFVLKILKIDATDGENIITEEEIRMMVDEGKATGSIQEDERVMIENIFELNDTEVSEIMTHRTNIVALQLNASYQEVLKFFKVSTHSRVPVYDDDIDDIVGVLHVRDILNYLMVKDDDTVYAPEGFSIVNSMRKPYFTPEFKYVDMLFKEMQSQRQQIAVVIDEYGGTAGLVTMEDMIEEIVGNLQDEYDNERVEIYSVLDNVFIVDGLTSVDDASKKIEEIKKLENIENYDTVAGLLISLLDRIPDENERPEVRVGNLIFKVLEMDEKRIAKIEIIVMPDKIDEEKEET